MGKSSLFTIFMVVFIGLTGFSFFIPLLPFYAIDFGANETVVGLVISSYALAQLIGAPILGRLSDRYGRRPILLISTIGTFLSLVMLIFANSLWMLFASRLLDGLTGGNISVAQAYITDVTDEKSRAKGLGLLGAAFGLGFIIGPAMGGILSALGADVVGPAVAENGSEFLRGFNWTYALPAVGASLIGLINVFQVIFTLPESLSPEQRAENVARKESRTGTSFSLAALFETLSRPRIGPLLNMRLFYGMAFSMFQTAFPLYTSVQLGLGPQQTAFVLTYVGILSVLVQGVAMGAITRRFSDHRLLFGSSIVMTFSLLAWAFVPSVFLLLVVLIPIAAAGGIFNVVNNSALTKAASRDEAGGILGISTALESVTRVVAPTLGNGLIGQLGAWSPGVAGALLTGATSVYVWLRIFQPSEAEKAKRKPSIQPSSETADESAG